MAGFPTLDLLIMEVLAQKKGFVQIEDWRAFHCEFLLIHLFILGFQNRKATNNRRNKLLLHLGFHREWTLSLSIASSVLQSLCGYIDDESRFGFFLYINLKTL